MRSIRSGYLAAGRSDVLFFSVCLAGTPASSVAGYVEYAVEGEAPPPATWPVFVDDATVDATGRECASSYIVLVADRDGTVRYHQSTQLTDAVQRKALTDAIDAIPGP